VRPEKTTCTCKAAAQGGECVGSLSAESERFFYPFLVNLVCPTRSQLVSSYWTKARAREQCPIVPDRIGLGIAILFLLIYISPGQFKKSPDSHI